MYVVTKGVSRNAMILMMRIIQRGQLRLPLGLLAWDSVVRQERRLPNFSLC